MPMGLFLDHAGFPMPHAAAAANHVYTACPLFVSYLFCAEQHLINNAEIPDNSVALLQWTTYCA